MPTVVIRNVRVIDGTGAPAKENQTIVISGGKIVAIGPTPPPSSQFPLATRAQVIAGEGKTVIPGFVMVHEHMFHPATTSVPTQTYVEHAYSFPRLYLGAGITTARTGGSMSPYADLNLKRWIDAGTIPGPKLDVTGPYLTGPGLPLAQFHELADSADARRTVRYWADLGATSFKAYMHITRDELRAAVDEAHKRGLKVTGHLCSVTFREAAEIGIDNLDGVVPRIDQCAARESFLSQRTDLGTLIESVLQHLVGLQFHGSGFVHLPPQEFVALHAGYESGFGKVH